MPNLLELYEKHIGKVSDKWQSYLMLYEDIFRNHRMRPIRILEIGVQNGGSLEIWSLFFPNAEVIVGCDINPSCGKLAFSDPRISVVLGDINAPETAKQITSISNHYDFIIDDGSHRSGDIIRCFARYFPLVSEGGSFIAEDIHCSYRQAFDGGLEAPFSSVAFFKRLTDYVNHEHWGANIASAEALSYFSRVWGVEFSPMPLEAIAEVRFFNSVCIVSKGGTKSNKLGTRVIAGTVAPIEPTVVSLSGQEIIPTDEAGNDFGPFSPRTEELAAARQDACHLAQEIAALRERVVMLDMECSNAKVRASRFRNDAAVARNAVIDRERLLIGFQNVLIANLGKIEQMERDLMIARRQPQTSLLRLLSFRLLSALSKASPPLSKRTAQRLARSAEKRNPRRKDTHKGSELKTSSEIPIASALVRQLSIVQRRFDTRNSNPSSISGKTLLSILLPVYNTPTGLLQRCLDTVLAQTYGNWELQIVDDCSTSLEIGRILDDYAAIDRRINFQTLPKNLGIAAATQCALDAAKGAYVCLLDHDDELTFDALEQVSAVIDKRPDVGLIYSDECKLSAEGVPTDIFAKPDWSSAALLSFMYIGHLATYKRDLAKSAGGFRSEFDYSQDYDLALRVTEHDVPVYHIPEVLYGWREIPNSAAAGGKPYARRTNIAALQAAADRRGWQAKAIAGQYANILNWKLDSEKFSASIVIPSDNETQIVDSINSIFESSYRNFEIIVVTNSQLIKYLSTISWKRTVKFVCFDEPFNFSKKCNVGAEVASGEIIIFFNDDVRVRTSEWMERIIEAFMIGGVGAVGPKLIYENETIQHAGMVTGVRRFVGTAFHCLPSDTHSYFNVAQSLREVSLLCGACLAVRKATFVRVGGFDAEHVPIYHSDVDLCFKIRQAGERCIYTPHAVLLHIGHVSIGKLDRHERMIQPDKANIYLLKRWPQEIAYDPFFPKSMRELLYHDSPVPFAVFPGKKIQNDVIGDVLIVSHDLSNSGAPRVALEVTRSLQMQNWFVVVASPEDGPMRAELEALGVTVVVDPLILQGHETARDFAKDYDLVIANTIVTWPLVAQLKGIVPVAWYIHEIDAIDDFAELNPEFVETLAAAQTVWAGSTLCAKNLHRFRREVTTFEYGVERRRFQARHSNFGFVRISVFGSYEKRKGQDLLAEAFTQLGPEEGENVILTFYGRSLDEKFKNDLMERFASFPNVQFAGELDHSDYLIEMGKADLVAVPSRSDTLPLVSLDALGAGIPLMCTRETGTSAYLEDGVSGFIISSAEVRDMVTTLRRAINERSRWAAIGRAGARVFETCFSESSFRLRLAKEAAALAQGRIANR